MVELIFHNGDRLYSKCSINPTDVIEKAMDIKLYDYQKQIINQSFKKQYNHKIYGDDFSIDIIYKNIAGLTVLSIKDYDEKLNKESEINISFTKNELNQLISLLQGVRDSL